MVRYLQLTDPHVFTDPDTTVNGVQPNACLARVVERIADRHRDIDFVVITGDLVGDDLATSYEALDGILAPIRVPIRLVAGNHDLRAPIAARMARDPGVTMFQPSGAVESRAVVPASNPLESDTRVPPEPEPVAYEFRAGEVRFLVLDSQIPGAVGGAIGASQLRWIEERIGSDTAVSTIVFLHHPPLPIGIDWLDAHQVVNGRELLAVLRRGNVLRVQFGHVHMQTLASAQGIPCASAPSTCYQFTDGVGRPKVVPGSPGFGVFHVEDDRFGGYFESV